MTPEAQRIALAEFCGWTQSQDDNDPTWWTHAPDEKYFFGDMEKYWPLHVIPDYLNDLNAVHAVVERLSDEQKVLWVGELYEICRKDHNDKDVAMCQSSAKQRCDALIRIINAK